MAVSRRQNSVPDEPEQPRRAPARTSEARENELIALSMDLAEKKLRDGSISSQVHTHFLKLGTEREKLERAKIEHEVALLQAKSASMASSQRSDEMYEKAINAFRTYSGEDEDD